MKTIICSEYELPLAAALLKHGKPVAMPTETVYGLAAPVFDEEAVRSIFSIKGRPSDNPLIAHISDLEQARLLASELPPAFYDLARRCWPGPLTLVVKRSPRVPDAVSAGHPTIAIRMPSHPIALKLIALAGPLVAPSANLSGRPSPTSIRDVLEDLEGKIALAIDGGACAIGIESTVLSLVSSPPTLLRPGQITREALEEALSAPIALPSASTPIHAPGMKYRHYAPKARLKLVESLSALKGPFILSCHPLSGLASRPLSSQSFYAELRAADRAGVAEIEIYCDPVLKADAALMNRILHAIG